MSARHCWGKADLLVQLGEQFTSIVNRKSGKIDYTVFGARLRQEIAWFASLSGNMGAGTKVDIRRREKMPKATAAELTDSKRKRREGPRAPSRKPGVQRHSLLLDATEALLQTGNPNDVGLYQIAERAGVPPGSVYHFFPTKEAAFVALANRFTSRLMDVHRAPIEARAIGNWTDLYRIDTRRAMEFYNSSQPALKIFYGGFGGIEEREVDRVVAQTMAAHNYARMNRIFHMPYLSNPGAKFEVRLAILDSIWTLSTRKHGRITEDYYEESYAACVAYSRIYLPERIERRQELIDAAEKRQAIVLPFDDETLQVI